MLDLDDLDMLDAEYIGTDSVDISIASGNRDVNDLTNIEFNRRHPERGGAKIQKDETALAKEWISIRDDVVRPALARSASASSSTALTTTSGSALSAPPAEGGGWSVGRILKYGVGGLASVVLLGWAFKHRDGIALEARAATRHVGQLAGRAKSTLKGAGAAHRSVRQSVAQERQAAQNAKRARKLEADLTAADRRVQEATRIAEQKARQLQALRVIRGSA